MAVRRSNKKIWIFGIKDGTKSSRRNDDEYFIVSIDFK